MIKKKLCSFLLLSLFLLPYLYFFGFNIQQQRVYDKMEERLEKENLITLIISAEEIQWVKYNKEVLFNGKMFDIKEIVFDDGEYIMQGLFDEDEMQLLANLKKNIENTTKQKQANLLVCWFQYNHDPVCSIQIFNHSFFVINNFKPFQPQLLDVSLAVITPPPNFCLYT